MIITGERLQELSKRVFGSQDVRVGSSSVDITLGPKIIVGDENSSIVLDEDGKPDYLNFKYLELEPGDKFVFEPGKLYIAHSNELVEMPSDVGAFLALRSTSGRRGLDHLHAGWIEPGWKGQITFELSALVKTTFKIGERIAQLVFLRAETHSQYNGVYQYQVGPVLPYGARII